MKTIKEFDYDLWAIEENGEKKYFSRVKSTGEESEISHDVMKFLLSEEKRMRRDIQKRIDNPTLSIDNLEGVCESTDSNWLIDEAQDVETQVLTGILEEELISTLTSKQRKIYFMCVKDGMSLHKFAETYHVSYGAVFDSIEAIRKKSKKFFA